MAVVLCTVVMVIKNQTETEKGGGGEYIRFPISFSRYIIITKLSYCVIMTELTLTSDGYKHCHYYIVDQLKVFAFREDSIP
jgi:hypothetical protein